MLRDILRQYWGYDDFRGIQRDIIESIYSGKDTLGLMPTGGGKSITFQVPALALEGVCIVITPLIALMKDQVQHLIKHGIRAAAIYSGMTHQEILTTLDNCVFGGVKILYVSPERLSSDLFQTKVRHMQVSFITVDEAHCISQWGYDFRPAYLEIAKIRQFANSKTGKNAKSDAPHPTPILALTATATPRVIDDIQDRLEFKEHNVFKMSFERKNLAYVVRKTTDKFTQLTHILTSVPGSAIVYVRSRRRTKEISDYLNEHLSSGTPIATYFHAGLDHSVKDDRQQKWSNDEIRIIVATNAFGMGIDKPNVRLVIHFDCPDSIEAYFQEAGRAGRDGRKAYAVLLYNDNDKRKLEKRISENFPEKDYIKKVYEHLAYFYQMAVGDGYGVTKEFDIDKFCRTFRHFPVQADAALKLLDRSGYIHYETDPDGAPRVMFLLQRDELYRLSETSPHEEAVITSMLRNYGGMFTDYSYIDESRIANETRLTDEQVYLCLKALSKRRILHFIPRSNMPTITYTQRREETEYIVIPKTVYEERKEQFTKRIRAIELYAGNDDVCRSRQLLLYFGEERAHDCGICDVCNQHRDNPSEELDDKRCQQIIMDYLADGKRHLITELNNLHIPERHLSQALQYLASEEMVTTESSWIYIEKPNQ